MPKGTIHLKFKPVISIKLQWGDIATKTYKQLNNYDLIIVSSETTTIISFNY